VHGAFVVGEAQKVGERNNATWSVAFTIPVRLGPHDPAAQGVGVRLHSRSINVAFAVPPASHMVTRP
jgi:hypothetical protein